MFKRKKATFEDFTQVFLIPLFDQMVELEAEQLYGDVLRDAPYIKMSLGDIRFELFILFYYLSGRPLTAERGNIKHNESILVKCAEVIRNRSSGVCLNNQWLDNKPRAIKWSDSEIYYLNKTRAYREAEVLYSRSEISKDEFEERICEIFLSANHGEVSGSLAATIGAIHRGGFMCLSQNISEYFKKFKIVA